MKVRSGYTLLEVMLAIAIGLLLVAALYIALDVQFRYMQSGRNAVVEAQVARGLLTRMADDVRPSLAVLPSRKKTTAAASGAAAPTDPAQPAETAPPPASGEPASTEPAEPTDTGPTTQPGIFNQGVYGSQNEVYLFVSATGRYYGDETGISDLRRIHYYLVPGQGLYRQEQRNVLSTSSLMEEEEPGELIANEVVGLEFEYMSYDPGSGSVGYSQTWTNGLTDGPPMAVRITLVIESPARGFLLRPEPKQTTYSMVVAIPGANVSQEAVNALAGTAQTLPQ